MHLCNTAEFRIGCTSCVSFPPNVNCRFSAVIFIDTGALFPIQKMFLAHFYFTRMSELSKMMSEQSLTLEDCRQIHLPKEEEFLC